MRNPHSATGGPTKPTAEEARSGLLSPLPSLLSPLSSLYPVSSLSYLISLLPLFSLLSPVSSLLSPLSSASCGLPLLVSAPRFRLSLSLSIFLSLFLCSERCGERLLEHPPWALTAPGRRSRRRGRRRRGGRETFSANNAYALRMRQRAVGSLEQPWIPGSPLIIAYALRMRQLNCSGDRRGERRESRERREERCEWIEERGR